MRAFVLLGGILGPDGPVVSPGMIWLTRRLNTIDRVKASWHCWSRLAAVVSSISALPDTEDIALVGYSGGGTRAIFTAHAVAPRKIKLAVLYDPSPRWQVLPISDNVERTVCYWNIKPMFLGFGGGKPDRAEIVPIAENHLLVQADPALHRLTLKLVGELARLGAAAPSGAHAGDNCSPMSH